MVVLDTMKKARRRGVCKYPCSVCSVPVKNNDSGVQCDGCDVWTHCRCAGVSDEEYC